jgi:chorismate--pyruvate lyase
VRLIIQEKTMQALELKWQQAALTPLPNTLNDWILHPASFMSRLKEQGATMPRVQLLRQTWQFPALNEKVMLGMTKREYALVREVVIYSDGKKWMYARTVFPRKTLTGKQLCLARLKNRSLGSVLFKDPTIERSPFDVVCLSKEMDFHQYVLNQSMIEADQLWARRSTFVLNQKPLLLTEVFLPDLETL